MKWQPIKTAPVDEYGILWNGKVPVFGIVYERPDGSRAGSSAMSRGLTFTHWMPLPPPPEDGQ